MPARKYTALILSVAWRKTSDYWDASKNWTTAVSSIVIGGLTMLYKHDPSFLFKLRDMSAYTSLSYAVAWTGTFVINLIRAPKLIHDEAETNHAESVRIAGEMSRQREVELLGEINRLRHANEVLRDQLATPDIDLTVTEGVVPTGYVLLRVRAVNKGAKGTVREWTLTLEPSGFVHWSRPLPEGLLVDTSGLREVKPVKIASGLDETSSFTPIERGAAVEGWLFFRLRGKLSAEDVINSTFILRADDDLGQTHTLTAQATDWAVGIITWPAAEGSIEES